MEKKYKFVLNVDLERFESPERNVSFKSIRNQMFPRKWFHEELDTPGLSADSTYEIVMGGKVDVIEKSIDFLTWCYDAIA